MVQDVKVHSEKANEQEAVTVRVDAAVHLLWDQHGNLTGSFRVINLVKQ